MNIRSLFIVTWLTKLIACKMSRPLSNQICFIYITDSVYCIILLFNIPTPHWSDVPLV